MYASIQCSASHGETIAFGVKKFIGFNNIHDLKNGDYNATMKFDAYVFSVAFSPCGRYIAAGLGNGLL